MDTDGSCSSLHLLNPANVVPLATSGIQNGDDRGCGCCCWCSFRGQGGRPADAFRHHTRHSIGEGVEVSAVKECSASPDHPASTDGRRESATHTAFVIEPIMRNELPIGSDA